MFPGTRPHVERCRRVGATCRDRQPGKHVNEKSHRQPRVPAADGVPRRHRGLVGSRRKAQAVEDAAGGRLMSDDGMDWRFGIRFSVN